MEEFSSTFSSANISAGLDKIGSGVASTAEGVNSTIENMVSNLLSTYNNIDAPKSFPSLAELEGVLE